MVASLDHAMWFMRPFRADEWLLGDQFSPSANGGRALTQGQIFNQSGDLVAAVVQEGLTRYKRGVRPGCRVSVPSVGVLALQGDTREHLAAARSRCGGLHGAPEGRTRCRRCVGHPRR